MNSKEKADCYEQYEKPFRLDTFHKIHWKIVDKWEQDPNIVFEHVVKDEQFQWGVALKQITKCRKLCDFSFDQVATYMPGEWECLMFGYAKSGLNDLVRFLKPYLRKGLWFNRINQECLLNNKVTHRLNAKFVSAKIAGSGSDIYGLYYAGKRKIKSIHPDQHLCFGKLNVSFNARAVVKQLMSSQLDFAVSERGTRYGGPKKNMDESGYSCFRRRSDIREFVKAPSFSTSP